MNHGFDALWCDYREHVGGSPPCQQGDASEPRAGYNGGSPANPGVAFWWVNHKQTFRQETEGGYVWSPKANANGARNVSYDNLTLCQRGDVVFSYAYGRIGSIGWVEATAITGIQPNAL